MLYDGDALGPFSPCVYIFGSLERACSCKYSYDSGLSGLGGGLYGRLHSNEPDRVFFSQSGYGCGCGRVAGYNNYFASFAQKEFCDGACSVDNVFTALFAVWTMCVVRVIDIALLREKLTYLLEHR